jgi:hypothetical protein
LDGWGQELDYDFHFRHFSFHSIKSIIKNNKEPLAQIWSVWAIYYICLYNSSKNVSSPERDTEILSDTHLSLIKSIADDDKTTNEFVRQVFSLVLLLIQNVIALKKNSYRK